MGSGVLFNKKRGLPSQLELSLGREREEDRNYHLGGRSFYFFDFDDNVAFLSTPLILFHKETGEELSISSGHWAAHYQGIGQTGPYAHYEIREDSVTGTFRHFRDIDLHWIRRVLGHKQAFVRDVMAALGQPDLNWKGPSWSCFYHATFNRRPTSVITARGHRPETIKKGIRQFVKAGHLPNIPNFLSVYPVSYEETREALGDKDDKASIPELKKRAIFASVDQAKKVYGDNPHHRFGMSDDDPKNIELIVDSMQELKIQNPQMSFFVIDTHESRFVKWEVFENTTQRNYFDPTEQLALL